MWDDGDWLCLQCGRYYYTRLYQPEAIPDWQWGRGPGESKKKATALCPVLLHEYLDDDSVPVACSPVGARTASTAADALIGGMGLMSRSPAKQ